MEFNTQELIETRMRIVELRNSIRMLRHNNEKFRFKIESDAINESGGNYGKNAEERERFLKSKLNNTLEFVDQENELLNLQHSLELAEAKMDCLRDLRREAEMILKERMLDSNLSFE